MSDTEQNNQPRTEWGPIIKDMLILIIVMGGLGALCKLAMLPFQEDNPSEDLISIASKGNVNEATGKDEAFEKELAVCLEEVENFSTSADKDGRTPLMWVVYANYNSPDRALETELSREYYIKKLLALPGTNVNQVDKDGFTAVHWASWSGLPLSVALLAEAGADVNTADSNGYTPLMLAAMRGNAEVVRVLLALGAAPDATLPDGRNAADMSARNAANYADSNTAFYSLIYKKDREKSYRETITLLAEGTPAANAAELVDSLRSTLKAKAEKAKAEKAKAAADDKAVAELEVKAEEEAAADPVINGQPEEK